MSVSPAMNPGGMCPSQRSRKWKSSAAPAVPMKRASGGSGTFSDTWRHFGFHRLVAGNQIFGNGRAFPGEVDMPTSYAEEAVIHPAPVAQEKSGVLVSVTRERANGKLINFAVRRLLAGQYWQSNTRDEEAALVVLGGKATADWGEGPRDIGGRKDVFSGYSQALYLPSHTRVLILRRSPLVKSRTAALLPPLGSFLESLLQRIARRRFAAEETALARLSMSFVRSFLPTSFYSARFIRRAEIGRAILRISMTSTILPSKWISTKPTTTGSADPKDMHSNACTTPRERATTP